MNEFSSYFDGYNEDGRIHGEIVLILSDGCRECGCGYEREDRSEFGAKRYTLILKRTHVPRKFISFDHV